MNCPNCHTQLPQESRFCGNCGTAIPEKPQSISCPGCGNTLQSGSQFCPYCGTVVTGNSAYSVPLPTAKKKSLKKPLIFGGVAAAAIVAVVLIISLISSLLGGPMTSIAAATVKTLEEGNLTLEMRSPDGEKLVIQTDVNLKSRDLTLVGKADGEYAFIIYRGYFLTYNSWSESWYAQNISETLEQVFDAYEKFSDLENLDLEALLEDAGILNQVEAYVDLDHLSGCVVAFGKKLNSKSWLEENAGYASEKDDGETLHSFDANAYEFLSASLPLFEKAFTDSDDYEMLQDGLKEAKSMLKGYKLDATVGVKRGVLSSVKIKLDGQTLRIAITDVGKTDIDRGELDEILENSEKY